MRIIYYIIWICRYIEARLVEARDQEMSNKTIYDKLYQYGFLNVLGNTMSLYIQPLYLLITVTRYEFILFTLALNKCITFKLFITWQICLPLFYSFYKFNSLSTKARDET